MTTNQRGYKNLKEYMRHSLDYCTGIKAQAEETMEKLNGEAAEGCWKRSVEYHGRIELLSHLIEIKKLTKEYLEELWYHNTKMIFKALKNMERYKGKPSAEKWEIKYLLAMGTVKKLKDLFAFLNRESITHD